MQNTENKGDIWKLSEITEGIKNDQPVSDNIQAEGDKLLNDISKAISRVVHAFSNIASTLMPIEHIMRPTLESPQEWNSKWKTDDEEVSENYQRILNRLNELNMAFNAYYRFKKENPNYIPPDGAVQKFVSDVNDCNSRMKYILEAMSGVIDDDPAEILIGVQTNYFEFIDGIKKMFAVCRADGKTIPECHALGVDGGIGELL